MKGRHKKRTHSVTSDPMKLTWTNHHDSAVSLKKEDEVQATGHVFRLTESEIEQKVFHLRYNTCTDVYYRLGSDGAAIQGWQNGIYAAVNIERRVEDGLAYLTRAAGHSQASVSWKVDLTDSGLVVDSIQALTLSRTLHGGIITYDIVSADTQQDVDQSGSVTNGWQTLYLVAYLSGSRTIDSYDQTQLLYQEGPDSEDIFPLDILLTLKPLQEIQCTCPPNTEHTNRNRFEETVQVHSPAIEQCQCFFPNSDQGLTDNRSRTSQQRAPSLRDAINPTNSIESLSIVNKHVISLPGTPVHRKEYGSLASAGSSSSRSRRLNKKNKVQSSDLRGYDNSGAESPIPMHALKSRIAAEQPSEQQELRVLDVRDLEAMGSRRESVARRAWPDKRHRDSDSLMEEADGTDSRRFCKGMSCTIS